MSKVIKSVYVFCFLAYSGLIAHCEAKEINRKNRDNQIDKAYHSFYQGDFGNALKRFEDIVKIYPTNSQFVLTLAKIYFEKADFSNAQQLLRKALEINPNNAEIHYYLARVFFILGDNKQTIEECIKTLQINPQFYVARKLLADAYRAELDDMHAEVEIKKLLELTPESALLYWELSDVYGSRYDLTSSIAVMRKAVSLKANVPSLWKDLGYLYLESSELDKAVESFKKSLEINPNNIYSQYGLGCVYQQLGQLEEALKQFQLVLDKNSNYVWALYRMGQIYEKKGDFEKVREVALRGIKVAARNPEFHRFLATVYYNLGGIDYLEKAKEEFELILQLAPGYSAYVKTDLENVTGALNSYEAVKDHFAKANISKTVHYIIRTDMPDDIMQRLVDEGRAEKIFEDAKKFVSNLVNVDEHIEIPLVTVSIFHKRENFSKFYELMGGKSEARRCYYSHLKEIFIDGSALINIERDLLHETIHALLDRNAPNLPRWLDEGLAVAAASSRGIQGYLTKLIASPEFSTLDEKTLLDEKTVTEGVYPLYGIFGSFLLKNYYHELQEYIKMLQGHSDSKKAFSLVFGSKQNKLGGEFRSFIKNMQYSLSLTEKFVDRIQEDISYRFGHSSIEPEDIFLKMLYDLQDSTVQELLQKYKVTILNVETHIKKQNKPYYGNLSFEAERLLSLYLYKTNKLSLLSQRF